MLNKMIISEQKETFEDEFNAEAEYSRLDAKLKLVVDVLLQRKLAQR
jgi:hypothetical protein